MANQKKYLSPFIENKIHEFQKGKDFIFTGEEYHPSHESIKAYTTRTYQILSPQLQKVVQEYLNQQTAIFMQFDFKDSIYISERIRPDNAGKDWGEKYHACVDDENGDGLNYGYYGRPQEGGGWRLLITHVNSSDQRERFNQAYQEAKRAWEQKGSPLLNTPPSGTKCWDCYEVISDEDIAAGRYKVENSHFGPTSQEKSLAFYKTFEHVKGVCKPLEYDCALRNNYRYHNKLIDEWLKTWPQKKHEINCQDCLNRLWNEVNGNLIYLETWASEQIHEIDLTKQVLAEIEACLAKLKESGQFHNCGVKKCCSIHDNGESHHNENHESIKREKSKGLMLGSDTNRKNINQLSFNFSEKGLQKFFQENSIRQISLTGKDLLVKFTNRITEIWKVDSPELLSLERKVTNRFNQTLKVDDLNTESNSIGINSDNSSSNLVLGLSLGIIGGVVLLGLLVLKLIKKKNK